jgi:hypothetical protein
MTDVAMKGNNGKRSRPKQEGDCGPGNYIEVTLLAKTRCRPINLSSLFLSGAV